MKTLENPEQELRFTRAAQAVPYWLAAAVLAAAAITLLACALYRNIHPELPHPLWTLLPLLLAWVAARLAFRMTRHAYLILTPLGVEIFPLIRPAKNMRVVYWQEIAAFDCDEAQARLSLHFDLEQSSGIHLSLRPIPRSRREWLLHALRERLSSEAEKK